MSIASVTPASTNPSANRLSQQDFLKILLTQLTYQDPLKPMDNQEFMAHMAQFTSLEQTQQLNTKLEVLLGNHAALQSVGLIGRVVDVRQADGTNVTGTVSSLSLAAENPVVSLLTSAGQAVQNLPLSQIVNVR